MAEQDRDGLFRSEEWIGHPVQSGLDFVQKVERDQSVDGIFACPSYDELARHGMPAQFVDRIFFNITKEAEQDNVIKKILYIITKTSNHIMEKDIIISTSRGIIPSRLISESNKMGLRFRAMSIK